MADLIYRDDLKQTLLELLSYSAIVKYALEKAPAVDAVPVVRWYGVRTVISTVKTGVALRVDFIPRTATTVATEKGKTMAEYIERKAAIDEIMSEPTDAHYPSWYADKIKSIPAADVEPVRHGRWIEIEENHWNLERPVVVGWECSKCGVCGHYTDNYCPNCGAIMEGEKNVRNAGDGETGEAGREWEAGRSCTVQGLSKR